MNVVSMFLVTALAGVHHGGAPVVSSAPASGCCTASPGVVHSAPASDCCSNRIGLLDRLRGLFSRNSCDPCPQPCAPAPACAPAPVVKAPACAPAPVCAPAPTPCDPCARPSFLDRLRARFSKSNDGCCDGQAIPAHPAPAGVYHGTPVPPAAEEKKPDGIQKLPSGEEQKEEKKEEKKLSTLPAQPEITPAGAKSETGVKLPFDSGRRDVERAAHATDYSKLTGKLFFVHADGGLWVLRYAPLGTEDANGGSVVLSRDSRLSHYREGDEVTVEGSLTNRKGSAHLAAPLYQVRSISLVDRPLD